MDKATFNKAYRLQDQIREVERHEGEIILLEESREEHKKNSKPNNYGQQMYRVDVHPDYIDEVLKLVSTKIQVKLAKLRKQMEQL